MKGRGQFTTFCQHFCYNWIINLFYPMKVHEYQAKEIFSTYGIPVERHALCHTADGAVAAYHRMGVNWVAIKAQVLTGGRGKAGGVKLANNDRDVYQYAQTILEMTIKVIPSPRFFLVRLSTLQPNITSVLR